MTSSYPRPPSSRAEGEGLERAIIDGDRVALLAVGAGLTVALYYTIGRLSDGGATRESKEVGSSPVRPSGRNRNRRKHHVDDKRGARRRHQRPAHTSDSADERTQSSWVSNIVPSLKGLQIRSNNEEGTSKQGSGSLVQKLSQTQQSMDKYYDDAIVVGLDCEMVGGGRGGWKSLLARCSVVTLDRRGDTNPPPRQKVTSLDQDLVVLYDKYVIPKGKITDYRTQWSGISKDTYRQPNSPIPIVSFNQCQNEISQLFSSIEGKKVIVVGHALENDFDALEIEHPPPLIRDTAFHPPYMRKVRKKMYPRKLSTLTSEEFGIDIQQKPEPPTLTDEPPVTKLAKNGHDSVEDAAAALRLYWHKHEQWERSLGYPLFATHQNSHNWPPLTMYLDGCNLPVGMRGVDFKELMGNPAAETTIPLESFRLTSRNRDSNHPSTISTIDWIPKFQSALSPGSAPRLDSVSVMFDGAKFSDIIKKGKGRKAEGSLETRVFCLESSTMTSNHGTIRIEITENGDSADDVLVHRCSTQDVSEDSAFTRTSRKRISLDRAITILSSENDGEADKLSSYIVIRRKAGGSKTHRRLFDKLHLRRPNEGALCLSALTPGLQKNSCKVARELQRQRGVEKVIELELRKRVDLRFVVVTDDVLLTDRLVESGVLVLSFRQLSKMFLA